MDNRSTLDSRITAALVDLADRAKEVAELPLARMLNAPRTPGVEKALRDRMDLVDKLMDTVAYIREAMITARFFPDPEAQTASLENLLVFSDNCRARAARLVESIKSGTGFRYQSHGYQAFPGSVPSVLPASISLN